VSIDSGVNVWSASATKGKGEDEDGEAGEATEVEVA